MNHTNYRFRKLNDVAPFALAPFEPLECRTLLSVSIDFGGFGSSGPPLGDLTDHNGTLLYVNDDSIYGPELWRSDGIGAAMVKDIRRGPAGGLVLGASSSYQPLRDNALVTVGGMTFFVADDGMNGPELWRSDGTAAGTFLVRDIVKGAGGSSPTYLTDVGGTLFFFTGDQSSTLQLWRSDGTRAGTTLVKDLGVAGINVPSFFDTGNRQVGRVAVVGNTLYFQRVASGGGVELWKSDGTTGGTARVSIGVSLAAAGIYAADGRLYLLDQAAGDLWTIQSTTGAATRLADFPANSQSVLNSSIRPPVGLGNGTAVFGVLLPGSTDASFEIWATDGTPGGTRKLLANQASKYAAGFQSVRVGSAAFLTDGEALYRSDGTAAGTTVIKQVAFDLYGADLVALDGSLYYMIDSTIYRVANDGTQPVAVAILIRRDSIATAAHLTASGDRLFFIGPEAVYMRESELWSFNPQSPRKKLRMLRSLQVAASLRKGRLSVPGTRWFDDIRVSANTKAGTLSLDWNGFATQAYRLKDVSSVLVEGRGNNDSITLVGAVRHATVSGGDGADYMVGGDGDDVLQGDAGDDRISGGGGDDDLYGGEGNDVLDGGAGRDVFIGGGGDDTADYGSRTRNLMVTLDGVGGDGERGEGDNVFADVETIWGGIGDDYLVGSVVRTPTFMSKDGELQGGDGKDTLIGGPGNDSIVGGSQADSIDGGGGNDTLYGDNYYADPEVVYGNDTLTGGLGNDSMQGGGGNDLMTGAKGLDTMFGGDGNDVASGGWGFDSIDGEAGNDTLAGDGDGDDVTGGDGNDLIHGGDDDDALTGGAGNDTLYGDAGEDDLDLDHDDGKDQLFGGPGNDNVWGGGGADLVDGGRGWDTGYYEDGDTHVSIEVRWGL
jgi:ELWxxDGT repeat protein